MLILMTMALSSQDTIEQRLNNYILTFQMQKITYNGVEGFFIPLQGHKQLVLMINDYIYCQDLLLLKDIRIKNLERFELENFRLKTALGVTIAFDVGASLVAVGLGLLCYNIAKQ